MLKYEDAIKEWGYRRLSSRFPKFPFERDSITVSFEWDEGYACCGGSDPNCYCSFAESPYNYVVIKGARPDAKTEKVKSIVDRYIEFDEIMRELFEIGVGA